MADGDPKSVIRFDARGVWNDGSGTGDFGRPMTRALFRDDEIVIEWPPGEQATLIVLRRTDGNRFKGESTWASGKPAEKKGVAEAELFSNDEGHVLIGEERWPSGEIDWFVVRFENAERVI